MNYILDTCVISELCKQRPRAKVVKWINSQQEERLYLTAITIGEIQKGIFKLPDSPKKATLQHWLDNELITRFERRILCFGIEESRMWGKIQAIAEKRGQKMPTLDGWIAAIALAHNMKVVTRNVGDMAASGVSLINPWE